MEATAPWLSGVSCQTLTPCRNMRVNGEEMKKRLAALLVFVRSPGFRRSASGELEQLRKPLVIIGSLPDKGPLPTNRDHNLLTWDEGISGLVRFYFFEGGLAGCSFGVEAHLAIQTKEVPRCIFSLRPTCGAVARSVAEYRLTSFQNATQTSEPLGRQK